MLFNKKNQRTGDRLAGTAVVKLTEDSKHSEDEAIEKYNAYIGQQKDDGASCLKIIVIIIAIGILFFCTLFFGIISLIKSSSAYKEAIYQIQNNEKVLEQTGNIEGYGFFPTGSVSTNNGVGNAEFVIKVKGSNKDVYVHTVLSKFLGSKWRIVSLEVLE
ncbi:cytochrome oxidase complex assembly protein 1 [Oxobacter pfennigii]|uniref:Cytochrome oxidase complex assembly protein 1 n=1 Tax=Oxobacter pfennigii TaxID=36849 RepID=A0A0P8YF53_9CLOT|nr:cytochrome c oxidase assembly factor Coa1 family protein [Oxobacter pfennigii]KPU45766.1 cytochrome oxidase complex assembly protein 1 [Oxobacter pfennigii]